MATKTRVVRKDGTDAEYAITPKVIVLFERQFNRPLSETSTMEHIYWLTWKAEWLAGKVVKPFDEWLDDIEDVENVQDEESGRFPTEKAPSPSS